MTPRFKRLALAASLGLASAHPAAGESGLEAFDGSFRLQTGEVVTGGYFVEEGQGRYLYMDVQGLDRGGLFERAGDTLLRSVVPPGSIEIEFVADAGGVVDALIWNEAGSEPLRGERIHPHQSRPIRFASADGTRLRGRLLLPSCAGPRPLVVSVHGSGPVDRHGGPYHTFFLQHGVAVLAYDKRGFTTAVGAWREPDWPPCRRMRPLPRATLRSCRTSKIYRSAARPSSAPSRPRPAAATRSSCWKARFTPS